MEKNPIQTSHKRGIISGFSVKSWGDLVAITSLSSLLFGVLAWGLKLEGNINAERSIRVQTFERLSDRVDFMERQIAQGTLPRSEERLRAHDRELDSLERRIQRLEQVYATANK